MFLFVVDLNFEIVGVMTEMLAICMLHSYVLRVAPLHLTSVCDEQDSIKFSSLEGAVFPAGLTKLALVSFCLLYI